MSSPNTDIELIKTRGHNESVTPKMSTTGIPSAAHTNDDCCEIVNMQSTTNSIEVSGPSGTSPLDRHRQDIGIAASLKPKPFRESRKIVELRKLARKKYPGSEVVIDTISDEDTPFVDSITEFINNKQLRRRGDVLIRCKGAPPTDLVEQWKAMEVYTVRLNERSPGLVGQRGLRALIRIPAGTIIGEYFGREFLENEFDDIYGGTKEWVDINQYAQGATVQIEIPCSKMMYFANVGDHGSGGDGKDDEKMVMEFRIVVDGLNIDSKIKAMLIYTNDCRQNIFRADKTREDEMVENVKLMRVEFNGWPKIFGIATKDIEQNEEMFTYYGAEQLHWEQDKRRNDANIHFARQNVKRVLDHYGIDSRQYAHQ